MANTDQIPSASPLSRKWVLEEHIRNDLIQPVSWISPGIEGVEGVRGQKPDGSFIGGDFIFMRPHSEFPMHTHEGDHVLYVSRGVGFIHIDGGDYEIYDGDLVYIPAERPHRIFTKDLPLWIVAFGHPHKELTATDRMKLVEVT